MRSPWARALAGASVAPRPISEPRAVPGARPAADALRNSRRENAIYSKCFVALTSAVTWNTFSRSGASRMYAGKPEPPGAPGPDHVEAASSRGAATVPYGVPRQAHLLAARMPPARRRRWWSRVHGTSPWHKYIPGPSLSRLQSFPEERNRSADHLRVSNDRPVTQTARHHELGPRPRLGNLLTMRKGHVFVFTIMNDQGRSAHAASECGYVQLFPTNLKPGFEVPAHSVVGADRDAEMIREGMREEDDIGRRGEKHCPFRFEAIRHRK